MQEVCTGTYFAVLVVDGMSRAWVGDSPVFSARYFSAGVQLEVGGGALLRLST